ncbi:molybdopterin oxidoreductase family protein [Pelagibius litoralis]|uniref:Molybdopterin oxidoreductase family protein n=1 Tax=Pelagibius litoralis TaxID=374515 RepID=A0A967F3I8_9PROT|nr:molybdopterin oxidoreductase family protein [Pelagibius litoralis]NIA72337.1 molybdopterin oxidoreductase family protein [Pelagibius litoralis]
MPLDTAQTPVIMHSTCPHDCPSVCALEVERLSESKIGKVRGARDNDYTAGVVCAKVARYAERVHHPDRLTQPLRRIGAKGGGISAFEPISWEAALDAVAEGLLKAEQRHGSEAVWPYFYAGTMGLVQRDGIERLRHAKRYSRQYSTICTKLVATGWNAACGSRRGVDAREMAESDLIVVWGGNPVSTQVNVMTHIAKARKGRGAKLVVVDPYRTGTAEQADMHLALKPGTDGALAAAVISVLLAEGHADRDYLAKFSDWDAELEAHFAGCTPAWAAGITGLSEQQIREFATLYGTTQRSYVRLGYGFSRARNGASAVHAVACLPTVTGAWQHRGGGAMQGQSSIYGLDETLIQGLDMKDQEIRSLDQSRIGPILTGDPRDLGEGPPVTALFIQNTNPMAVCPESGKVAAGFARDDLFTCVHEQFMTETAAMADVVLPATTFLEHDDVYVAGGHTYLQVTKAVINPLSDCRSNHEVICALAQRLGASHPGFEMTTWELIEETLKASGLPNAKTIHAAHWHDCILSYEDMHFLNGFGHADKRFHFKADWAAYGPDFAAMPALPGYSDRYDRATPKHPFRLVAAPARTFLNSTFTETPGSQKREGKPTILIHPEAAADLGVATGERLRIGNDLGSLVIAVELFDGLQKDVVVVESIWPNSAFEEGWGINLLISADPGPPAGGAVFHDTAVWLKPA